MTRWNVKTIFFFSITGERRDVELALGAVNVITGASGTGKSALIKTLDYCLGSSKCELPAYVRRRCVAVGVKWVAGEQELVVGRIVPPVGKKTSSKMFLTAGRSLALPSAVSEFEGETTVEVAKSLLEQAFGIGDTKDGGEVWENTRGRSTVRHLPPYLFVTKEVIYSETVLLHGLDDKDKADGIVESMPYFLRAETDSTAIAERHLRQLRKALEVEEAKERARSATNAQLQQRAFALLVQANQLGLVPEPNQGATEVELVAALEGLISVGARPADYVDDSDLSRLYENRRAVLSQLGDVKRERQATEIAIRESEGFRGAVGRQHQKLMFAEYLNLDNIGHACPLCDSVTDKGAAVVETLKTTIEKIRAESAAVERVQPAIRKYADVVSSKSDSLNAQLRENDAKIRGIIKATEESRRLADLEQLRAHFLGRVSYFLETASDMRAPPGKDLSILKNEIAELEAGLDRDAKAIRLRHAESVVSRFASEIFGVLPKVAPCNDADLDFTSRKPEVTMIEKGGAGAILRMPDIGSDQNYLAVHIALSFALQRYFKEANSPVPGLLVLDQISRPYFPSREESDETTVEGEEDEEFLAMRKHINFLFAEVERQKDLQVLLIEHAYFADDRRYVTATKERWTRASKLALIPLDWQIRSDSQ